MKALDRGRRNRTDRSGFTLVELMIVVVIMVILAAAAVPVFTGYAKRAKDSKAIAECRLAVQAAQVKAGDLYAAGKLAITTTNNTISDYNDEILALANVKGKILQGPTVDESSQVVFVLYECENGTQVRYDFTKNPKYAVMAQDAPLTVIKDWTKKADQWLADIVAANPSATRVDRQDLIASAIDNGGLLKVDNDIKKGTPYENQTLYWRPYYIGNFKDNPQMVLYATTYDPNSSNQQGSWDARLVYADGKVYVSPPTGYDKNPSGTGIAEWAGNSNVKAIENYTELEQWLSNRNFTIK